MDPVSTGALAALILASRGSAEELGKEAGRSAWAGLAKLRVLVASKFHGDAHAKRVLVRAEQRPQDPEAIARLQETLEAYEARDRDFAIELRNLVDEARRRPEYQPGSQFLANYGVVGKMNVFNAPIEIQRGDFNIN
jgi:geranylgeranyl pyrophosphate synthase